MDLFDGVGSPVPEDYSSSLDDGLQEDFDLFGGDDSVGSQRIAGWTGAAEW